MPNKGKDPIRKKKRKTPEPPKRLTPALPPADPEWEDEQQQDMQYTPEDVDGVSTQMVVADPAVLARANRRTQLEDQVSRMSEEDRTRFMAQTMDFATRDTLARRITGVPAGAPPNPKKIPPKPGQVVATVTTAALPHARLHAAVPRFTGDELFRLQLTYWRMAARPMPTPIQLGQFNQRHGQSLREFLYPGAPSATDEATGLPQDEALKLRIEWEYYHWTLPAPTPQQLVDLKRALPPVPNAAPIPSLEQVTARVRRPNPASARHVGGSSGGGSSSTVATLPLRPRSESRSSVSSSNPSVDSAVSSDDDSLTRKNSKWWADMSVGPDHSQETQDMYDNWSKRDDDLTVIKRRTLDQRVTHETLLNKEDRDRANRDRHKEAMDELEKRYKEAKDQYALTKSHRRAAKQILKASVKEYSERMGNDIRERESEAEAFNSKENAKRTTRDLKELARQSIEAVSREATPHQETAPPSMKPKKPRADYGTPPTTRSKTRAEKKSSSSNGTASKMEATEEGKRRRRRSTTASSAGGDEASSGEGRNKSSGKTRSRRSIVRVKRPKHEPKQEEV